MRAGHRAAAGPAEDPFERVGIGKRNATSPDDDEWCPHERLPAYVPAFPAPAGNLDPRELRRTAEAIEWRNLMCWDG